MNTKSNNTETAAAAPEAPQDEYEYFRMVAKKYLPLLELDEQEYRRRMDNDDHSATEPKLPPNEEAEYLRRMEEFRERRREAGLKIDPETAEICGGYTETFDPYDIHPLLPREFKGYPTKTRFARSPGSDIWVEEQDLPDGTVRALEEKYNPGVSRKLTAQEVIKIENEEPF
jgi:hypothetical protein